MKDAFFQIIFETPPAEVELSTELKCREVMKSNDIDKIKALSDISNLFYISGAGIVGAYMGTSAWMSNRDK